MAVRPSEGSEKSRGRWNAGRSCRVGRHRLCGRPARCGVVGRSLPGSQGGGKPRGKSAARTAMLWPGRLGAGLSALGASDRPPARPPEPGSGTTRVSLCLRVFKQCHGVIPPQPYYQGCVFDHCHVNDPQVVCSGLELYATLCASHGTCVDWRGWTNHTCRECRPPGDPPPPPAPLPGRQTAGGLPGGGGLTSGRV